MNFFMLNLIIFFIHSYGEALTKKYLVKTQMKGKWLEKCRRCIRVNKIRHEYIIFYLSYSKNRTWSVMLHHVFYVYSKVFFQALPNPYLSFLS